MSERIRGSALQRLRKRLFRRHPLCQGCLAKTPPVTRLSTQRDHRVPLHKGGTEAQENEQALCDECHLQKSKLERGHAYRPTRLIGRDGFPIEPSDG